MLIAWVHVIIGNFVALPKFTEPGKVCTHEFRNFDLSLRRARSTLQGSSARDFLHLYASIIDLPESKRYQNVFDN